MLVLRLGVPGGIRTPDLKVRSLAFYPAKLQAHITTIILYTQKAKTASYFIIIPNNLDKSTA